jgi:succinylarginine dihydrolase
MHLSKRMPDHYKHISEKAARKASDALSRFKTEQRAEARAMMQEQARVDTGLIHSDAISALTDAGRGQSAVGH